MIFHDIIRNPQPSSQQLIAREVFLDRCRSFNRVVMPPKITQETRTTTTLCREAEFVSRAIDAGHTEEHAKELLSTARVEVIDGELLFAWSETLIELILQHVGETE